MHLALVIACGLMAYAVRHLTSAALAQSDTLQPVVPSLIRTLAGFVGSVVIVQHII